MKKKGMLLKNSFKNIKNKKREEMPVINCPVCNVTVFYDKYNTEFLHDCSESTITSLKQEDRININNPDYAFAGTENKLQGKTAGHEGQKVLSPLNRRGRPTSLYTSRDRITHIDTVSRVVGSNPL